MKKIHVVDKQEALALVDLEIAGLGVGDERIIAHLWNLRKVLESLGPPKPNRTNAPRKPQGAMERKGTYLPDEVFPHIQDDFRDKHKACHMFGEDSIHMDSLRYKVFRRSLCCVKCGIEGKFFAKERSLRRDGQPGCKRYHLNLYAVTHDGREVLMTKDHRIARSNGGSDSLDNLDTMCGPCNWRKGARND